MTRLRLAGTALLLVCALAGSGLAQSSRTYRARLAVVPIDVIMQSTIAGSGSATAVLSGKTLTITGTYEGLVTPATVARLHRAWRGIRGPAFADLKVSGGTSGTIGGSVDLTPAQIEELGKIMFYMQLHSEKAPDGNLWGWLFPVEEKRK
jgi:CHRD domain